LPPILARDGDLMLENGADLLSQRTAAGTVHFYGYDGQGSVRKLYNSSGTQTDTYVYDA